MFTAPALTDDAALRAVFTDAEVPSGDTGYDVGGTITGPDGKPISDATVDIGGHTGTTDGNGNFIVEDVPPGTHTVTVTDKDGNVIGIGEITIEEPDGNSLTWTTDGNGNPVIIPGRNTTAISLTMTIGEDGVISIGNVKDVTPARAEQEQPEDTGKPGAAGGGSSQTGSKTAANSSGSAASSGSPATGDEINLILWFSLLTLSLCGFVGIWIFQKKKQSKL